jgi:hypothetical protein
MPLFLSTALYKFVELCGERSFHNSMLFQQLKEGEKVKMGELQDKGFIENY